MLDVLREGGNAEFIVLVEEIRELLVVQLVIGDFTRLFDDA